MAKEFYNVSFRTYFNERLKPTVFRGKESYPLYVQVTYDRKTLFFKSYYFELFAPRKYDFLRTTISQIDKLEGRVIDFIIARNSESFELDRLPQQYKVYSQDVLDNFDRPFKLWLAAYLKKEGFPGLAALLEYAADEVCAIQVWDDLKKILDPESFGRMEKMAVSAGPYLPLATYVRHVSPEGPFCLPVYEWSNEEKRIEIENFIDQRFWGVDFGMIIRQVRLLLFPRSFDLS
jgi:hypothetical protein